MHFGGLLVTDAMTWGEWPSATARRDADPGARAGADVLLMPATFQGIET